MTDDIRKLQPDARTIEFDDPNELAYWVKYLDTSKDELLAAISVVGTTAQAVKDHLREKRERNRD
jgi:hypothetical protein